MTANSGPVLNIQRSNSCPFTAFKFYGPPPPLKLWTSNPFHAHSVPNGLHLYAIYINPEDGGSVSVRNVTNFSIRMHVVTTKTPQLEHSDMETVPGTGMSCSCCGLCFHNHVVLLQPGEGERKKPNLDMGSCKKGCHFFTMTKWYHNGTYGQFRIGLRCYFLTRFIACTVTHSYCVTTPIC
jgi:hypothetical protein